MCWYQHNVVVCWCDVLLTSLTSSHQILDKHTTVYMFCSKWISDRISHLRLRFRCDIALRVYKTKTKKSKSSTQYALATTIYKQTQIAQIRHERPNKEPEAKTNQTSYLQGNHWIVFFFAFQYCDVMNK
jgi:hypothetical protein